MSNDVRDPAEPLLALQAPPRETVAESRPADAPTREHEPARAADDPARIADDAPQAASPSPLATAIATAEDAPAAPAQDATAAAAAPGPAVTVTPEAPKRRQAARPKRTATGRAIVITSGKGGVGKTTVTANLGAALADAGKKVAVVDADVGLRNLDVVMGLENRVRLHSLDVIEERCSLADALVRDRVRRSLMLLPAAQNRDKDEIDPEDMADLVDELQESFDIVLIDCPAGIEQGFRNAVGGAQEAIIVTTPEVSAVRDADRVAGLLPNDMPARLIINRLRPQLVRKGTMMSVDDVLEILRLDLVGVVPDDKEVIVATNRGNAVIDISGSATGAAIRRIAARLLGERVPIPDLTRQDAWFTRVFSNLRPPRSSAKG